MSRILVMGAGSFIGRYLSAALPADKIRTASHATVDEEGLLDSVDTVVWCGRDPRFGTPDYDLEGDHEVRLARLIGDRPISFLTLGTRKVYRPSPDPLREDFPVGPFDAYGEHKLKAEDALASILGERLTRLRLANIFGDERGTGRRTFMTQVLGTLLADDEIRFAISPYVARDFLPVEKTASVIAALVLAPPGGIVNVGSGIATPCGRLALWLIEGYGRGRLVIDKASEADPFVLDVDRQKQLTAVACSPADVRDVCILLGRKLWTDKP